MRRKRSPPSWDATDRKAQVAAFEWHWRDLRHYFYRLINRYPLFVRDDLEVEAQCGVWRALLEYDPAKGAALKTHMINHATWAIQRYMRDRANLIKVPANSGLPILSPVNIDLLAEAEDEGVSYTIPFEELICV